MMGLLIYIIVEIEKRFRREFNNRLIPARNKTNKVMRMLLTGVLSAFLIFGPAWASDDTQSWSRLTLKTWQQGPWSLSTYGDLRLMDDVSESRLYLVSEQLKYRWLQNMDLGVNYTYLESKARRAWGPEEFKYQHRLELEANPGWSVWDRLMVKNRNRVELRRIEDQGSDNTRFRQLWELSFPLRDKAAFKSIYTNNEIFVDDQGRINENWVIPLGAEFDINDKTSLKIFYMVQSRKGTADWSSNQIIGTHVVISF